MKKIVLGCLLVIAGQVMLFAQSNKVPYKVADKIKLPGDEGWDYLKADGPSNRLFVSHGSMVQVVDLKTKKLITTITGTDGVHGVALVPSLNKGFISDGRDNAVTVFDYKTLKVTGKINVTGTNPDAILYDPFSKRIFTCNGGTSNATAIDAETGKVVGTIALSGRPETPVTDGKGKMWINIEDQSRIAQVNPVTLKVEREWSIAPGEEPSGLAIDVANHRIFSVCRNNLMVVSDVDAGKVLTTLPIGSGPDGAAFDPVKKLAFSSNGDGTLTVVKENNKNDFTVLGNLDTQRGARTITLDNLTHHLYLSTASYGPMPTDTTGNQRFRRPPLIPGSFVVLDVEPE